MSGRLICLAGLYLSWSAYPIPHASTIYLFRMLRYSKQVQVITFRQNEMAPFLGFVLVTHSQPQQTSLLCWKLSSMFNYPPIAIHHDFSKCDLDPRTLPPQVRIVKDWVVTEWGALNLVDAYLAALRLLHSSGSPDWTINLSSADYPIKSARYIIERLQGASADAFFDYREICKSGQEPLDARSCASTYKSPEYMAKAYERYLSFSVVHYHIRRPFGRGNRAVYVSADWLTRLFTPFSNGVRLYAGDWWHIVNRLAAEVLMTEDALSRKLRRYYKRRPIPDESYCQTRLLNEPGIRVENNNYRYTVWTRGAYHPKLLEYEDVPDLVESDAYFARKFPFTPSLYEMVDEQVRKAESSRI